MPPQGISELLSYRQAAEYLDVSERTVRRLTAGRKLAVIKVSKRCHRFTPAHLEEYLRKRTVRAL